MKGSGGICEEVGCNKKSGVDQYCELHTKYKWNKGQKAKNCLQYAVSCWKNELAKIPESVGKLYEIYHGGVDKDTKTKIKTPPDWGSLADLIYYYSNSKDTENQNVATEFMSVLTDENMIDLRKQKETLSKIDKCIICVYDDGAHYVYKEEEFYTDKPGQSQDSRRPCKKPKPNLIKGVYAID